MKERPVNKRRKKKRGDKKKQEETRAMTGRNNQGGEKICLPEDRRGQERIKVKDT